MSEVNARDVGEALVKVGGEIVAANEGMLKLAELQNAQIMALQAQIDSLHKMCDSLDERVQLLAREVFNIDDPGAV